jgi:hypothetical protein
LERFRKIGKPLRKTGKPSRKIGKLLKKEESIEESGKPMKKAEICWRKSNFM